MCRVFPAAPATFLALLCCAVWLNGVRVTIAADRTTCFFPLPSDASSDSPLDTSRVRLPCDGFGPATPEGWRRYLQVWLAHQRDPSDAAIRQFLGLPPESAVTASSRRGRSAPRELGWRPGSYRQLETPHFQLFTRAEAQTSQQIVEDLERCYWIWTQTFYPLWEGSRQVSLALSGLDDSMPVAEFLSGSSARITTARKMKVVLFRDAAEYRQTLGRQVPGIEQSTGYYSDPMRITFLYAAEPDDAATRRHELVHQMFREATRSGLGRNPPGETRDFWLVEGIAGYFESLWIGSRDGTLGGWDSPRLQFARHRVLTRDDRMPMSELRADGREAAQQRADLARWYAHAIAQTHRLLDDPGGSGDQQRDDRSGTDRGVFRSWTFAKLAELYQIPSQLKEPPSGFDDDRAEGDGLLESFLRVDDEDLLNNRVNRPLRELYLAKCEVTGAGLRSIPPQRTLQWLDLSRLPITDRDVTRLVPDPVDLQQLSLEETKVTPQLGSWLGKARHLRELDLSWTASDDQLMAVLPNESVLETLWLTGSGVSNDSIDKLGSLKELGAVDLQRTAVDAEGLRRLRRRKPKLEINPLELRTE